MLGSIGTVVYRSMLPEALPEAARDTPGGAVATGDGALVEAARDAFTQALQATAVVSAAILAATAVLAVTLLRHARAGQPQPT